MAARVIRELHEHLANIDDAITAWERFPTAQAHQTMDTAIENAVRYAEQLTKLITFNDEQ